MDLGNITSDDGKGFKTSCDRCSSCCVGGGPILRFADAHLIRTGKIPSANLYTIRKGEFLFDRDKMAMVPVTTDLIKINVTKKTMECIYLKDRNQCEIYTTRPTECRAFKCWDTTEIEMKYSEDPLQREDLLGDVDGLWDLISDHQGRCSYAKMKELTEKLSGDTDGTVLVEINEMIAYDNSLRETLVEKAKVDKAMLPFLLGRPFMETIAMFNMKIEEKNGCYYLDFI
ncbi:MAG: YkgJ family cysteine cluster protein [Proteobacteria bacterium]|nr:YkgJ family cysteine cluster protein [Pseudomonadota bacterium]